MTSTTLRGYTLPMQRDVALFHDSFGMPNLIATPGALPLDRIALRIGLLREEGILELTEAIEKNDTVAIIDALIDTVYVALGALVEMGADASGVLSLDSDYYHLVRDEPLVSGAKTSLATNCIYLGMLEDAFRTQDTKRSVEILRIITLGALLALTQAGIDPQPFFDEVQRANMSKLGADGKPVHSRGMDLDGYPAGKVLKGANYSPPDLAAVFARLATIEGTKASVVSDFMRGARAAAEAMRSYFLNENEGSLYEEISTEKLESFEASAVQDALRDERTRIERGGL